MRLLCFPFLALYFSMSAWGAQVRLESSSPAEVSFVAHFNPPEWHTETFQGAEYRYPVWPECATATEPGEPEVPYRIVSVALPARGDVRLEVSWVEAGAGEGVRFAPAPKPERDRQNVYPRPEVGSSSPGPREEGAAYGSGQATPRAELLHVGLLRGVRVAQVRVSPVSWTAATESANWAEAVTVTLHISGNAASTPGRGTTDPAFDSLWSRAVINPQSVRGFREAPSGPRATSPAEQASVPEHWFDDAEAWVRIHIAANGLYRVSGSDLQALGIELSSLNPQTLRLFSGPLLEDFRFVEEYPHYLKWLHVSEVTGFTTGFEEPVNPLDGRPGMKEVAIALDLGGDGSLDPQDDVIFYALGPDNYLSRYGENSPDYHESIHASETVYWLGINTDYPWAPARIQAVEAAPTGPDVADAQRVRTHLEKNSVYDPSMHTDGVRWERYFWRRLTTDVGVVEDFALPDPVGGSTMDVRVRLWGANQPIGSGEATRHHARIDVNGRSATVDWPAFNYPHFDTTLSGVAAAKANRLEISVIDYPVPSRDDIIHLAWADVTYERELLAHQAPLEFDFSDVEDGLAVQDMPSGEPWILDVTDFRRPVRLLGVAADGGMQVRPGRESGTLLATADGALAKPAGMERKTVPGQWLRDTSDPVDYVIITHAKFRGEAERLADHRRTHLAGITESRDARVRVVDVADVYDEFSWGMPDPMAIRLFLEYAWRYYGPESSDRLAYCLFLGDTTYDPRDYEHYGVENLVPTWMYEFRSYGNLEYGNVQFVTDDFFTRFDGPFDVFPDIASGRIPAATEGEARLVIDDKIIGGETNPDRGPWRAKAILVADDVCQAAEPDGLEGRHMGQTEQIGRALPLPVDRFKLYLFEYGEECLYPTKPQAKQDLLDAWNDGAWLVNYIGHGASIVLADERVLDLEDIPGLTNSGRWPLFTAFSCSVGKFTNPGLQGIGESVVKGSHGAASASVVATWLTNSYANTGLAESFFLIMFDQGASDPAPIGASLWMSKLLQNPSIGELYVLLGDPGARVNVPESELTLNGVSSVERGRKETLEITPANPAASGFVDVIVQDATELRDKDKHGNPIGKLPTGYRRNPSTLFHGESALDGAGPTEVQYVTPVTLREGDDARIRAYAWGDTWDGYGTLAPLNAGGRNESPSDSLGPEIAVQLKRTVLFPGEEVGLALNDEAGIDVSRLFEFRGVLVRFRDKDGVELARLNVTDSFAYDLGSYTQGSASFLVPDLKPGEYDLVISSFDNYANRGELTLAVEVGNPGAPPKLNDIYAYPNPLDAETQVVFTLDREGEVEFTVYSIRGRKVMEDRMRGVPGRNSWVWSAQDALGDEVANGVYLLQVVLRDAAGKYVTRHIERLAVYR